MPRIASGSPAQRAVSAGGMAALVSAREIIVCCGPGGVGKTTIAAAMAVEGARQGRRTCVVTIDPARRLADAMGLNSLANSPRRVEGRWPGELWAVMLDTKTTFDALVIRYAADPGQAQSILGNRLYRSLSESLSGTQEYMAMEKLHELHEEGRFDLIVVDTPPTRNALDFLSAPRRITRLLDNRVFRMVVTPTRAYLRAANVISQTFLRATSRIVGSEMVKDTIAFFQAFEGMEDGVRRRAERVQELLSQPSTAFVVVISPSRDAVEEASFFAECLWSSRIAVQALIVNRLHPHFDAPVSRRSATPTTAIATQDDARDEGGKALAALDANLEEFRAVAEQEESQIAPFAERVAPAPVARVPFFAADVHDLDGLSAVADELFATGSQPTRDWSAIGAG